MFWNRNAREPQSSDFITLYKGEDIHPSIASVFDWAKENVWQFLEKDMNDKTFLAGGALRSFFTGSPVKDYDLYFKNADTFQAQDAQLSRGGFSKQPTDSQKSSVRTKHSFVEGVLTQHAFNLIYTPHYASAQDVIKDYDFTVCMCALTPESITYHPHYFTDLAVKALRIYNPESPLNTVWRMQKYVKLGYTIDRENMHTLLEAVHDITSLPNVYTDKQQKEDNAGAVFIKSIYGGS